MNHKASAKSVTNMNMRHSDSKATRRPETSGAPESMKKICLTYFKTCRTYFKTCRTYFSARLSANAHAPGRSFCMALIIAALAAISNTSCSDDEHTGNRQREKVNLLISIPGSTTAGEQKDERLGDPGSAPDEGSDWNRMAIIFAYDDGLMFRQTLTKDDFDRLPDNDTRPGMKQLTLNVPAGNTYIYGVTYSSDAANNPADAIEACGSNTAVQSLTISNDYASVSASADYAKFLSVATGYYAGNDGQPAPFTVDRNSTGVGEMPTMTLQRLATKIDIQWDAADAYTQGYTDVKVTDFKYCGKAEGRLFPSINTANAASGEQEWTFYNTSDISQRNGRVYHYTFTDGEAKPHITFNINAKHNGTDTNNDFTLTFSEPLHQAAWYKINATIRGITGTGDITLTME